MINDDVQSCDSQVSMNIKRYTATCSTYFNILIEKFSTFHNEFLTKKKNQIFLNRKYLKTTSFYVELALLDSARGPGPRT